MSPSNIDSQSSLRRAFYWLLIITSVASVAGRIISVQSRDGATPFLSANDRSRWCTIRALVDDGTYAIDNVIIKDPRATRSNDKFDKRWKSIDMVRHKGRDGREHYYSSKPTLFPTLLAGEYWLIKQMTRRNLSEEPFYIGRLMLLISNLAPLLLYFYLLSQLVEQYGQTHWGRMFAMAAATWGTFLGTFAITLNNHLPAAISALLAIHATLKIWQQGELRLRYFAVAGFFAAFTAANELPALSFFAVVAAALLWKQPLRTLTAFAPAAAVVVAGFFYTNYLAHDSLRPPYAHRSDGPLLLTIDNPSPNSLQSGPLAESMRLRMNQQKLDISTEAIIIDSQGDHRWALWDRDGQDRLALLQKGNSIEVRAWDNWYEYHGSYWSGKQTGVDLGEPSRAIYAFHIILGHHGIFSLTPIWFFSVAGLAMGLRLPQLNLRAFAAMVALLTIVCVVFYIARPMHDRNYGGVTCGLRWLFWFIPMWLMCMLPAVDCLSASRAGRTLALVFLIYSVFTASYASLNPWTQPWIFTYLEYVGLIHY